MHFRCCINTRIVKPKVVKSSCPSRLKKGDFRKWSEDDLQKAVDDVLNKKFSTRKAAAMYNIPKSTLEERTSGKSNIDAQWGRSQYMLQFSCQTTSEKGHLLALA